MGEEPRRIAIYSRKSRFTGKGESIDNQVELCREHIRLHYGEESLGQAAVYEDEGFSGGNLNRPGFRRMLEDARDRRLRAIVVYRLDRISRSISDFSGLIQELGRLGVDFVSIREQFDTATPMGRAMMYIASVFSQLERETIAERIRDNLHELAKTGRWLGGVTPTGYASESVRTVTVEGKAKKSCRLRLVPEEAELVREVYDLFLETGSLTATEAELLRRRVRTRNGRNFTRFSIRAILENPVYLMADKGAYRYFQEAGAELCSPQSDFDGVRGMLAYHRTDQEKGRATVYRPTEEWILSVGAHPGIIPSERWIRVQEALARNRSGGLRTSRGNEALLTGLLWCRCGSRMYPKLGKGTGADGKRRYSYVCKMKERSRGSRCRAPNVNGRTLDGVVLDRLRELPGDREELLSRLARGDWYGGRELAEVDRLRGERTGNERKIAALVDSLAGLEEGAARTHVAGRIEELHRENEALTQQIAQLEERAACPELGEEALARLGRRLARLEGAMGGMTTEEGRTLLRALVRRVVWDGEGAHVFLQGAPAGQAEAFREALTLWGEDGK